jgi:hypothetical protein
MLLEEEAVAAVLHFPFLASNCSLCLRAVVAAIPCSSCSQASSHYFFVFPQCTVHSQIRIKDYNLDNVRANDDIRIHPLFRVPCPNL